MTAPLPLLALHIAAGAIALAAGTAAFAFRKGSRAHVWAGRGFVVSMSAMLGSAAVIVPFVGRANEIAGILFFLYLVASAWQTVRTRGVAGRFERWTVAIPLAFALLAFAGGLQQPAGSIPPAGLLYFLAFVGLLAAAGDARYLRRGALPRVAKLSRHIWRISFAFFAATGSFFLGQAKLLPLAMQQRPWLLLALAVAPFVLMLFWLVRVRIGAATPRAPSSIALEAAH